MSGCKPLVVGELDGGGGGGGGGNGDGDVGGDNVVELCAPQATCNSRALLLAAELLVLMPADPPMGKQSDISGSTPGPGPGLSTGTGTGTGSGLPKHPPVLGSSEPPAGPR